MGQKNIAIGVDVGGTHISCAAIRLSSGEMLSGSVSRESYDHDSPASVIFNNWAAALNNTLSQIPEEQLAGIGFAIPGPFDYRNGISKMQHKFKQLYGLQIANDLSPKLKNSGAGHMRFINDATAFAIGEAWQGAGQHFDKVVVITLGTGFGSAFLHSGVPVVSGETVPKEGCLWHLPFQNGIADDYFSTRWFLSEYEKLTGHQAKGVKELLEQNAENPKIQELFTQFGKNLATCLAPWLRTFEAEVLIVGGNISRALPLIESSFDQTMSKMGVTVPIVASKLREDAAMMGSARLLDNDFWEKVSVELPNI
jgi:glucokinase